MKELSSTHSSLSAKELASRLEHVLLYQGNKFECNVRDLLFAIKHKLCEEPKQHVVQPLPLNIQMEQANMAEIKAVLLVIGITVDDDTLQFLRTNREKHPPVNFSELLREHIESKNPRKTVSLSNLEAATPNIQRLGVSGAVVNGEYINPLVDIEKVEVVHKNDNLTTMHKKFEEQGGDNLKSMREAVETPEQSVSVIADSLRESNLTIRALRQAENEADEEREPTKPGTDLGTLKL